MKFFIVYSIVVPIFKKILQIYLDCDFFNFGGRSKFFTDLFDFLDFGIGKRIRNLFLVYRCVENMLMLHVKTSVTKLLKNVDTEINGQIRRSKYQSL